MTILRHATEMQKKMRIFAENSKQMMKAFRTILLLMPLMLAGCQHSGHGHEHSGHDHSGHEHSAPSTPTGPTSEDGHSDLIHLPQHRAEAAGVRTEKAQAGSFRSVLHVSGSIEAGTRQTATLSARVSGIVHYLRTLVEGTQVAPGTPLLSISTRGLQEGDAAQRARIEYEAARQQYQRDSTLAEDQIVSQRHYLDSKTAYENARLAYEALGKGRSTTGGINMEATQAGYVTELLVREGEHVSVGQPLLRTSATRDMQLRALVPLRHAEWLSQLHTAHLRTAESTEVISLEAIGGKLLSVGRSAENGSTCLPVTFTLPTGTSLIPGSMAEVWLCGAERQGVISLPTAALTEEQGQYYVYIRTDAEHYRRLPVQPGHTDGQRTEILSGLRGGEEVVTQGATQVRMASFSTAIPGHVH